MSEVPESFGQMLATWNEKDPARVSMRLRPTFTNSTGGSPARSTRVPVMPMSITVTTAITGRSISMVIWSWLASTLRPPMPRAARAELTRTSQLKPAGKPAFPVRKGVSVESPRRRPQGADQLARLNRFVAHNSTFLPQANCTDRMGPQVAMDPGGALTTRLDWPRTLTGTSPIKVTRCISRYWPS